MLLCNSSRYKTSKVWTFNFTCNNYTFNTLQACLGIVSAVSLPQHVMIAVLLLGCGPTGLHCLVISFLQQANAEMALVLSLLQTLASLGRICGKKSVIRFVDKLALIYHLMHVYEFCFK